MAKGIYVGVGGVVRKAKKIYIGVNGVPRKVKKVFVGVGGVPKLVYSIGLEPVGVITPLSISCPEAVGGSIGNTALFVGSSSATTYANVHSYDQSLVYRQLSNLSVKAMDMMSANVGNYIIFTGGRYDDSSGDTSSNYKSTAFDSSLVAISAPDLTNHVGSANNQGVLFNEHAVFIGGTSYNDGSGFNPWDTYINSSLVNVAGLKYTYGDRRIAHGTAIAGNYCVFTGGITKEGPYTSSPEIKSNEILRYDTSFVGARLTATLDYPTTYIKGASVNGYALFAGGDEGVRSYTNKVYAIDSSLVKTMATPLISPKYNVKSVTTSDYAIFFAGIGDGVNGGFAGESQVEYYDSSLVKTMTNNTNGVKRFTPAGAVTGNYFIIAGDDRGYNSTSAEAYEM